MKNTLVISSIEDGLDFACNLAAAGIIDITNRPASVVTDILSCLAQYIEFRYVGEFQLAVEYLSDIGNMLEPSSFRSEQFWMQISWIAQQMRLDTEIVRALNIPASYTQKKTPNKKLVWDGFQPPHNLKLGNKS